MMALFFWIIAASAALLIQPRLAIFDYPLNLTVIVVYAYGINKAVQHSAAQGFSDISAELKSTLFGAAIGFIEDSMTGAFIGPNVLSKGMTGLVSSFVFREIFFSWDSVLGGIVLCCLTIFDDLLSLGMRLIFSDLIIGGRAVAELIVMQAVMNIPFGLLVKPAHKDAPQEHEWFRRRRYN